MNKKNIINNYILFFLSTIPISIMVGAIVSLANVLLISLSIFIFLKKKHFIDLYKDKTILCLLSIYAYLLFNSFISINAEIGFYRNFGFIRFILLFIAINYLFSHCKNTDLVFKVWALIILIVLFDSYFEIIFGKNILGYSVEFGNRIVSFFKDEPVVIGYLNAFIFILFGYAFKNFENKSFKEKFFIYLVISLSLILIAISGERSNTIKFIIGLLVFLSLNHYIKYKFKALFIIIAIIILAISYIKSDWMKYRYGNLFSQIIVKEKRDNFLDNNLYIFIYSSGIEVFKKYPYLGAGNKNYRVETCKELLDQSVKQKYICTNHPHQVYIEFLAEHGILGTIFLLSILFFLIFKNLKTIILSQNLIQIGAFSYLLLSFIPIIPSGSFFNDFNSTLFWLNFSILYGASSKTNIFKKIV